MARIVGHLPVEELEARYRASHDATQARHLQAIRLLGPGAHRAGGGRGAGLGAALGDARRRNGRTASLLTPELLAALAERLKRPPEDGGPWSGPEVAAWMARRLGLQKVHPQRGWDALRRIGWSLQAPRPRHARAVTPEQRAACK